MKLFNSFMATAFLMAAISTSAQISYGGRPTSLDARDLPEVPVVVMPEVDVALLMAEDAARETSGIKGPWKFGHNHAVDLGLENSGSWHELPDGARVWRLWIQCPGAFSINFEFHDIAIPDGARIYVMNDAEEFIGAFTHENVVGVNSLGVQPVAGERIMIEYNVPAGADAGSLRIGQVTHAYRDFLKRARDLGDSGSCNNNVICPEGDPWRDQIRSVAIIVVNGSGQCTGQLLNNCDNDGTAYFLTAQHCLPSNDNVSNWVFRFNWDSPQCGQNLNGPTSQTVSGAVLLAQNTNSDMAFLELNTPPPASYNVFYSGWNKSSTPPTSQTAIHHPSGDVKKISFDDQAAATASFFGAQCWQIFNWEDGTTEPGSSGSGLWDQNGLLIGQLYGGQASCSNNVNDYYGRFNISFPILAQWLGDCGDQLEGYPFTTEVSEKGAAVQFGLFPNPTTGTVSIQLPSGSKGSTTVRVFDATGRIAHEHRITGDTRSEMDLNALVDGIYFVEVQSPGSAPLLERLVITR